MGAAETYLAKTDPVMRRLIRAHGPCPLRPSRRQIFPSLVQAVVYQQLHSKAAAAIYRRFLDLFAGRGFPSPAAVLAMAEADLRACGLSAAKLRSIRDLAEHAARGDLPTRSQAARMDDAALNAALLPIRGIGRWTVAMLLIFDLGRPDVLPVEDFGVRNGFRAAYRKPSLPTPAALRDFGVRWAPYRTVASWYLWRAADAAKQAT